MEDVEIDPDLLAGEMPSQSLGSSLGESLGSFSHDENEVEDTPSPPRKTHRAKAPSSHRQSLAFELAVAMDDDEGGRDTMRLLEEEFGIREDENEGEEGEEYEEYEDEERSGFQGDNSEDFMNNDRNQDAFDEGEAVTQDKFQSSTPSNPRPSTPSETLRSARRTANLSPTTPRIPVLNGSSTRNHAPHPNQNGVEDDDEDEDLERLERETNSIVQLSESLKSTSEFVSRLKIHTTVDVSPTDGTPLSSLPHQAHGSAVQSEKLFLDRQPVLESLASGLISSIYNTTHEREEQVRELKEIERTFAQLGVAVLGELDELELENFDNLGLGPAQNKNGVPAAESLDVEKTQREHGHKKSASDQSFVSIDPDDLRGYDSKNPSSDIPHSIPPSTEHTSHSASSVSLLPLPSLTSSFLTSLQNLHESSQIHLSASVDVGRKLKHLKGVLQTWKMEVEAAERSRDWLEEWEKDVRDGKRSKGWMGEEAKKATTEVEEIWNKAMNK